MTVKRVKNDSASERFLLSSCSGIKRGGLNPVSASDQSTIPDGPYGTTGT